MSITTYQVQNILRTYGKQLGRARKAVGAQAPKTNGTVAPDQVEVSNDARRRQVIAKIAQEIIGQITSQNHPKTPLENQALNRLSEEFGQPLEVFRDPDGNTRFAVIDPQTKQVTEELTPEENRQLSERFLEITKAVVNETMIA